MTPPNWTPEELQAWADRHSLKPTKAALSLGISYRTWAHYIAGTREISPPVVMVALYYDRFGPLTDPPVADKIDPR